MRVKGQTSNKAGGVSQNGMKNKRLFFKLAFKTCLFLRAKQKRTILFPHMYVFQRKKKGHFGGVHLYHCKIYVYMCMGRATLNIKQFIEYSEHIYIVYGKGHMRVI